MPQLQWISLFLVGQLPGHFAVKIFFSFKTLINDRIDLFISTNVTPDTSAVTIWEACKAFLRGEIISFSEFQRKRAAERKSSLSRSVAELQSRAAVLPSPDLFDEILTTKAEFDCLQ